MINIKTYIKAGLSAYMERKHDVYFKGFIPYRYLIENTKS